MFVLHIELKTRPGLHTVLKKTYLEEFKPAISVQPGFKAVQLLHANDSEENYRLCLSFEDQASQQKWVATDLHQKVWPAVADQCDSFSVQGFTSL